MPTTSEMRAPKISSPSVMPETTPSSNSGSLAELAIDIANMLKAFIGLNFMYVSFAFSNSGLLRGAIGLICITLITEHCCLLLLAVKNSSSCALPGSPFPIHSPLHSTDENASSRIEVDADEEAATENAGHLQVTYGDIANRVAGPTLAKVIDFALILTQFGFCVSYLIFLSQTLHDLLHSTHASKWFVLVPLPILMIIALLPSVRSLGPFSLLANFAILTGFVSVVAFLGKHFQWRPSSPPLRDFPLFFGEMTAALEGIGLVLPVENSMKHPERFPLVLRVSLAVLSAVLMVVGILGFASFGDGTRSIILLNFGASPVVYAVKIVLLVGILFTYPLQIVPVFHYFERALLPGDVDSSSPAEDDDSMTSDSEATPPFSGFFVFDIRRITIRAAIVLSTAAIAVLAGGSFGLFQSLIGSLGGTILAYCAPPILYNLAFKDSISTFSRMKNLALLTFGVVGGVMGTFTTVKRILDIHQGHSVPI